MISMGYMTSSLFGSTCPRPQAPLCLLPLNASILRLPSTPLHAPPPQDALPWFSALSPGLIANRYFPRRRSAPAQTLPLRVGCRAPQSAHRSARLVVVKVHEEAQVPPLLPGIHKLPAEEATEVDVVAAASPVPIGAPRPASPVVARAGLDGALGAGASHRVGDPSRGDREDKCCFPTACGGRDQGSAKGRAGCRVRRAPSVEGLGPWSPPPRLRPGRPGGGLCWEAGLLGKARAWARNHVHSCPHALET